MKIHIVTTDLWRDDDGWMANGAIVDRQTITMPDDASDLAIARAIKSAAGIQGWRVDEWAGAEWSWRNGTMGCWADVDIGD